jgi:hypothetical protein
LRQHVPADGVVVDDEDEVALSHASSLSGPVGQMKDFRCAVALG